MSQQTFLYNLHKQLNAQLADFAGWQMPLNYGSQIQEHHAVRKQAGMFDVSHMGVVDIQGAEATAYLRHLLANDVQKLQNGKALYTCLLNSQGGIIDDLIVYRINPEHYRIVVNAGRRSVDVDWFKQCAQTFKVEIRTRFDLGMIAVQGPAVMSLIEKLFSQGLTQQIRALPPFGFTLYKDWHIARTGYTGEEGIEVILPGEQAPVFWRQLLDAGVQPCGLGARDTLRLEAGLNLYGVDMNEKTSPLESNLAWTVAWQDAQRNFIGRDALAQQMNQGLQQRLVGITMQQPGVLRNHQRVKLNEKIGEITSGGFSPTLGYAIALARIPMGSEMVAEIERRGEWIPVTIVKPPFIKKK